MIWMNGVGRTEAREVGHTSIGDIGKACGAKWREMSEADKAPWAEKAEADKKRYEREMAAFNSKVKTEAKTEEPPSDDDDDEEEEED